jgi:hypothetical protein
MDDIISKKALYNQHKWNVLATLFFLGIFFGFINFVGPDAGEALSGMTLLQFVILSFATLRLTKLFVSDHITQWMRDLFFNITEEKDMETGMVSIVRTKPAQGLRRILADLINCSSCVGSWMAFLVMFLYLGVVMNFFSLGRVILYLAALAGAGSFLWGVAGAFRPGALSQTVKEKNKPHKNVCTECGLG